MNSQSAELPSVTRMPSAAEKVSGAVSTWASTAPGEEGQRRAHHHRAQSADPRVARDHAAGHDEHHVGERAPAGPGRDQQAEETGREQRDDRAAPGQPDRSRKLQARRSLRPAFRPGARVCVIERHAPG